MSEISEVREIVRRIEVAILGDEKAGIEGLVNKVNRHEKQLGNIYKIIWGGAGVLSVSGIIIAIIKLLL